MQKYKILIFIAAAVIILDHLTKAIISHYLYLHQSIEVIDGFFNITYIRNPGAAFGLFRDSGEILRELFLTGTSLVALVVIFFFYKQIKDGLISKVALSLVAGGAVGNLIDRVRFGEVVDFLDFYIGQYHWPAFNIADSAITIGVFLLLVFYRTEKPH